MAANTSPIFTLTPNVGFIGAIVTANNTLNITSGTSYLVFTAGSFGSFVEEIRIKADPVNNTVATVVRAWINNGSATGTAANSSFFDEVAVLATTASATTPNPIFVIPVKKALPAGYKIYLTIGTAPGGSGQFSATCFGGDY